MGAGQAQRVPFARGGWITVQDDVTSSRTRGPMAKIGPTCGRHEVWTNGEMTEPVPRHKEIDEHTARSIVRKAEANPGVRVKP